MYMYGHIEQKIPSLTLTHDVNKRNSSLGLNLVQFIFVPGVCRDQAISLLAEGGELFSASCRCSVDLMTSGSLGLATISSLLQLTGEPISGERSPGFSEAACRAAPERGRFSMYIMLPILLETCRHASKVDVG